MTISRRVRYAAKAAYQLGVMRGIYSSVQCGMHCRREGDEMIVTEFQGRLAEHTIVHRVPIAKAWINL